MKKVVSVLLVAILVLGSLVGCGQKPANTQGGTETTKPAGKAKEITIALHSNPNTTEHLAAEKFKQIVEEKSKGSLVVKVFPGSQLGSEKDNLEQIKIGEIQMSVFGDLLTSQLAGDLDPTVIPYIYPSVEEVFKAYNGPLGDRIKKQLIEKGNAMLIGLEKRGARNLTSNKKIEKPEDLKGLKVRVPEIPTWVAVWKGLGALPTPIAFAETYSALQTKVVDAQENPFENISTAKFYEVQKYTIKTEHLFNMFHWAIGKKFYDTLTPEEQKLVTDTVTEVTKWADGEVDKKEKEIVEMLKSKGMEIVEVDKKAFAKAALPHIQELAKSWQPGVYDEVKKFLE